MPRRRSQRYHQRQSPDDEFETPALQIAAQPAQQPALPDAGPDSDDDLQSESGLGESPEEDLIEDQHSDNKDDSDNDDDDDDNATRSGQRQANDDSDSDSAPEDVSFAKTREAETKRLDLIKGVLTQRKAEERERRRKRDELFKMQKKEKVAALKKRKLPEDVLKQLTQTTEKKPKMDAKEDNKDAPSTEEDREEEEEEDFDSGEEDFIPLGLADASKEQRTVVSLKGVKGQGRGTPFGQSVADFKRDMLYGARHKRVTSHEMRQQKAKIQARR